MASKVVHVDTLVKVVDDKALAIGAFVRLDDGSEQQWFTSDPQYYVDDHAYIRDMYREVIEDCDFLECEDYQMLFDSLKEKYDLVLEPNQ